MKRFAMLDILHFAFAGLFLLPSVAHAADCKVATVGKPHSTCWDIADAADISVKTLQKYNKNLDCDKLTPGQRLCVSSGSFPVPKPKPDGTCASHTVKADETCAAIANRYGVTTSNIEKWSEDIWRFRGCKKLQVGGKVCVSKGKPPSIPVNPEAECGPETKGNQTCPLNVCCSAHGFCGQTSEFCEDNGGWPCNSNCGYPKLTKCEQSDRLRRKVGYYAGWGARRKCSKFKPENLNLDGFTDVIFAFAMISEGDYKLVLDEKDDPLLKDVVKLKDKWPTIKVTIAVGGWAFSQGDPTKTIFSQMIATSARRAKFIKSVQSFIEKYGLDGVDIDLEYPAAMEIGAPEQDTPNLTALMKELRKGLGDYIVSIATPASYWFLKGFEIDKISEPATYINVMTYDYHGPWDLDVEGEDGKAKPHTSMYDIMNTYRLYDRADVPFWNLNMGLAWYGRTFAVGKCKGLGCPMFGGGKPGRCTGEEGIKSYEEIKKEIADNDISPTYDPSAQAYWYNHDGDFVTFDDEKSWHHKTEVAREHCFGGIFIWSLDQGIPNEAEEPPPKHEVACQHALKPDLRVACKKLVMDIDDTAQFDLNGTDKCHSTARGLQPIPCHEDCCLYIGQENFQDVMVRAREVKAAALSILEECHDVWPERRRSDVGTRAVQLVPLFASKWLQVAFIYAAGVVILAIANGLKTLFQSWGDWNDDEERGKFVQETIANTTRDYPEFNVVLSHHDHTPSFQSPCYHMHLEFDRPAPHGTYGYEVYLARRGEFELHGDGGWINWGWGGYIKPDPDNEKFLTFRPPGANYGNVRNVEGKYEEDGEWKTTKQFAVGLGSPNGCATTFGHNHEDTDVVRCEDVEEFPE